MSVQVCRGKCRAVTNNFYIGAKQLKRIFKSTDMLSHGGVGGEQRRKAAPSYAHRSPQQLDFLPLTLDIPDHLCLPGVGDKLARPARETLALKEREEEKL